MKCKCLNPVVAWRCGTRVCRDGLVSANVVFSASDARDWFARHFGSGLDLRMMADNEITLPCNKCAACKIRQRKDLSTRLSHEASVYENKCYITLTYNDDNLPLTANSYPTLVVSHVQLFVKRLRRYLEYHKLSGKIRYFCVGEYGGKTGRPHYHLLIFGWRPADLSVHAVKGNITYFRSPTIEKLWKYGYSLVEDVSAYACRYCARYVTKKFVTDRQLNPWQLDEFILRSCKTGGTGAPWFDKFGRAACELGYCTYRLKDTIVRAGVPRYYYNRLRRFYPDDYVRIKEGHLLWIKNHKSDGDESYRELERHVACEFEKYRKQIEESPL